MRILRYVKKSIQNMFGSQPRLDITIPVERYGRWHICSKHVDADSIVFSFGVGEDVSFDLSLIGKYGLTLHAFDPTPRSIDWVKDSTLPKNFIFHEYGLAHFDGSADFICPMTPRTYLIP